MSKVHVLEPALAAEFGVEEALVIHSFQWWIDKNRSHERHFQDGRTWTYATYRGLGEHFPYLNRGRIRRVLDSLVQLGVLLKRRCERDDGGNAGNWFAFADECRFLQEITCAENDTGCAENGTMSAENGMGACKRTRATSLGDPIGKREEEHARVSDPANAAPGPDGKVPEPSDRYFANPAGLPIQPDPMVALVQGALFLYYGHSATVADQRLVVNDCLQHAAAGVVVDADLLGAAAAAGRTAWAEERHGHPAPRYVNCFQRAFADLLAAGDERRRAAERESADVTKRERAVAEQRRLLEEAERAQIVRTPEEIEALRVEGQRLFREGIAASQRQREARAATKPPAAR